MGREDKDLLLYEDPCSSKAKKDLARASAVRIRPKDTQSHTDKLWRGHL